MNKTSDEKIINEPDCYRQSVNYSNGSEPPYEIYTDGIIEIEKGRLSSLLAFLIKRNGGEVVAAIAIIVLSGIAKEFISQKDDGFDGFALIGCFVIASMIFTLGLLAMLRATKFSHAKNTEEQQSEKTKPGISSERTDKNGAPT